MAFPDLAEVIRGSGSPGPFRGITFCERARLGWNCYHGLEGYYLNRYGRDGIPPLVSPLPPGAHWEVNGEDAGRDNPKFLRILADTGLRLAVT